jgi:hypothetical protein
MLCTAHDPNVSGYVARREARGMPAVDNGTLYDIISKICDHELAVLITCNMLKHDRAQAKEKETDAQAKAQEKESEEPERPEATSEKMPEEPQAPQGRQSLGEYFISHPPNTYAHFGQPHSQEEEPEVHEAAQEEEPEEEPEVHQAAGYEDDQPHQQNKVSCFVVLACLNVPSSH